MNRVAEIRRTRISGRMDNHERKVGTDWVVQIGAERFEVVDRGRPRGRDDPLCRRRDPPCRLGLDAGAAAGAAGDRRRAAGPEGRADSRRLPGAAPRRRPERPRLDPAAGRTGGADAGKAGGGHLEAAALPDAGPDREGRRRRGRRGAGGPAALHGRGDEDGEHPARRAQGVVAKINAAAGDSLAVDEVIMEFA